MVSGQVIYEEEHERLEDICDRLVRDALAKAIFIIDQDGQVITYTGETSDIETTSLASLVAGSAAATDGIADMLDEDNFPVHFHEGEETHLHVSVVQQTLILVVIFDDRSSLGLVRLRVKRAYQEMEQVIESLDKKRDDEGEGQPDVFGDISDDELDDLVNDTFG
jgi:predicted regulator of Ras-like GTPase activity (Roadblock/LC7/MglB family)